MIFLTLRNDGGKFLNVEKPIACCTLITRIVEI